MTGIVRFGDLNMGHSWNDQTPAMAPSKNVFANGLPAMQIGDPYVEHGSHNPIHMAGSSDVFINGVSASNIGSVIWCRPDRFITIANGSPNVFVNNRY